MAEVKKEAEVAEAADTMDELKMIKLVTGEVVLGKVEGCSTDSTTLLKPVTLMLDPMQQGVGMIPYNALYTQEEPEEHTFEDKFIMEKDLRIDKSFREAYIQRTTDIELAPKPDIIV